MADVRFTVQGGGQLSGELRVPGDKSVSHRAVMFGALARGTTQVTGFLDGEDCLCTMRAFRAMGVRIEQNGPTALTIDGAGLRGLAAPPIDLDLGNSGTSMRLMAGILAAQPFATTLTGDASLSRRPMRRIVEPLSRMGARIETSAAGTAPLRIRPAGGLQAIRHESKVASAQVKSGVLLAGLQAAGRTEVIEPGASRDHTERMLQSFGVQVDCAPGRAAIEGGQALQGTPIAVPSDISSAAFFLVGAALIPGSELLLREVGVNPTRRGIIDILRRMGARIDELNPRLLGAEPVADLRVTGGTLRGIAIGGEDVAIAIDEFPALFVAAACAEGETVVTGAEELRVKESDRIQVMADGLQALGAAIEARPDGARIRGLGAGGALRGGSIDSHGDHRVAMAFAMAALRAGGTITIRDCANVDTSFPGFAALAAAAGLAITVN